MKRNRIFLQLLLLITVVCAFTACEWFEPHNRTNFRHSMFLFGAYSTSNYEVEDSVLFVNESGQIDTFRVKENLMYMLITGKTVRQHVEPDTTFMRFSVIMQCHEHLVFWGFRKWKTEGTTSSFKISDNGVDVPGVKYVPLDEADMIGDFPMTNEWGQSCVLRKNVGIIEFADENGHHWKLKEDSN